jgi:oxygen-independent coproporphyrinogen-3 oxidase
MAASLPAAEGSVTDFSREAARFSRPLIAKYDRPGPRYTSYPTAPQFREDFGGADYARLLAASRGSPLPLSLYVHLPFCEARCFFCGCNVVVSRNRERARRYLDAVEAEMSLVGEPLGAADRQTTQVHWGGGTPTFLRAEELARLGAAIRGRFALAPEVEFAVEVDPRHSSDEQLDALAGVGVNRLSLGIQDLCPEVQAAVNRRQPADLTWRVIESARRRGMASLNVDLIYGLPHQTPTSFRATVAEVVAMAPDRIALFNFAYLPALFRHQRVIDPAALPAGEVKLTLLEEASAALAAAGYLFIGMDHFARPQDPLARALADGTLSRNFQGYSTGGETDLVAFGVSAIGKVADGYAQNGKDIAAYAAAVAAGCLATCRGLVLTPEDRLRREVIQQIMCRFQVAKGALETAFGIEFDRHFAAELAALRPLAEDGLVELAEGSIAVTPAGRLLVRNVAMVFDAYLPRPREAAGEAPSAPAGPSQFSRTI